MPFMPAIEEKLTIEPFLRGAIDWTTTCCIMKNSPLALTAKHFVPRLFGNIFGRRRWPNSRGLNENVNLAHFLSYLTNRGFDVGNFSQVQDIGLSHTLALERLGRFLQTVGKNVDHRHF